MTHRLTIRDVMATGQCGRGIRAHWKTHAPAEWGSYEDCLTDGVDLELARAEKSDIIQKAVACADIRIAKESADG